jgi:predicted transcriptional regulator
MLPSKDQRDNEGVGPRIKRAIEGRTGPSYTPPSYPVIRTLMMNPVRRRIFSELCRRPCLSINDLAKAIGTSRANANWHIERMVSANLLSRRKVGRRWVVYPYNMLEDEDIPIMTLMSRPEVSRIYRKVRQETDLSQGELSKALGVPRQLLAWHLSNLVKVGLIETVQDGRFRRYRATSLFDDRAKKQARKARSFRSELIKNLKKDGAMPVVVKNLARAILIRLGSGKGSSVLEVVTDPYRTALQP